MHLYFHFHTLENQGPERLSNHLWSSWEIIERAEASPIGSFGKASYAYSAGMFKPGSPNVEWGLLTMDAYYSVKLVKSNLAMTIMGTRKNANEPY